MFIKVLFGSFATGNVFFNFRSAAGFQPASVCYKKVTESLFYIQGVNAFLRRILRMQSVSNSNQ